MSDPILPFETWDSGTNQNSIPANDNSLRWAILNGEIISETTDAQPGSPSDGDAYIMTGAASGSQWATFDQYDLVIYDSGTWYPYAPVEGIVVNIAGVLKQWNGSAYVALPSSDTTLGKQAIYIAASGIQPSVSGGCAALASLASAANQPDLVYLAFDPTTQEYAQFGFVMPEKWNGGTITFIPHWSHAATTTNFGVVWDLQAVAVANDGAIATAYGTAQTSTDTGGTTNDLYNGPESSAITVAGSPAGGQMVFGRLSRVTGNGSDTMAIDARLHGITVYVTTDAGTDA
jgi:hypothetical protein